MSDNNPFDRPPMQPSTPPPVSGDWGPTTPFNPIGPRPSGPGRGKIVAVALGAVALTGGAIFGISKFSDADDATMAESDMAESESGVESSRTGATTPVFATGNENVGGDAAPMPSIPDLFDSISECIDIEDFLGSMGAGTTGSNTMGSVPSIDFTTIGESVGDTVTITNADGVTIYTLGEGDASIAISKSGGEVTVAASGDVTESTILDFADLEAEMNDIMGELEGMDLESLNIEEILEGLDLENMDLENVDQGTIGTTDTNVDDIPAVSLPADFDPAEIQACIENLNLDGGG